MPDKKWTEQGIEQGVIGTEPEYIRLSDEKVKQLARDIISGTVFGSWQIGSNSPISVEQVFLPLLLMDTILTKRIARDNVAHVYEYVSTAAPMSVNGYPIFYSFHTLDQEDFERVIAKVEAMERAIAEL